MALVKGLETEEVGCRSSGGRGAFVLPGLSGHVVRERRNGAFPHIGRMSQDVVLGDGARELKVRIGDGTIWV
jgi:hypothetical protein